MTLVDVDVDRKKYSWPSNSRDWTLLDAPHVWELNRIDTLETRLCMTVPVQQSNNGG